jgi:fucose 4-O-acetylase-like acetyltransferase
MLKRIYHFFFQEIPVGVRPPRLVELDAARGVAIVLVVIGHIISKGEVPQGNQWFLSLTDMIYQFHMPFFMALTGISFALSLPVFKSWNEVGAYSLRRVKPLLVPFLVLGMVILIGKEIAVQFFDVSNPPDSFGPGMLKLLIDPTESAARFLWFIYVLSIYLMVVPSLFYLIGRRAVLLLIMAIILECFSWPEKYALRALTEYFPFFALGMVLWIYRAIWMPVPAWLFWINSLIFVGLLAYSSQHHVVRWLTGVCSILPILGLMQRLPLKIQSFWAYLGQNSLTIYLFSGLAMGCVKAVMFLVVDWDGPNFFFYFPLLVLAGVGIPLLIKAASVKWAPPVAKFI